MLNAVKDGDFEVFKKIASTVGPKVVIKQAKAQVNMGNVHERRVHSQREDTKNSNGLRDVDPELAPLNRKREEALTLEQVGVCANLFFTNELARNMMLEAIKDGQFEVFKKFYQS
jgi:hypothetical protein